MFSKLRSRLAALYTGLFAAILALVAGAVYVVVTNNAETAVRTELATSGTVFDRIWSMRAAQLGDAASLLAHDFGFRAAVATGDAATAVSALDNLKQRLGVKTAFIVDGGGRVLGLGDARLAGDALLVRDALDGGATRGVVTIGGRGYLAVGTPVLAPQPVGWVVFAADLGPGEMRALTRLSALPLEAAVLHRGARGWQTGEAGSDRDNRTISTFIDTTLRERRTAPAELDSKRPALALVKRLPGLGEGSPAVLLIRYPLADALAPYRPLQLAIGVIGLAGLLLVVLGSRRLAASLTRPITALDESARRLAQGDFSPVEVAGSDELGRLAQSFNEMATGIAEREQRIAHLAFNDTLTGLPNRVLFREQLELMLRQVQHRGERIAVLCIDLDNFKAVNDTLGHPVGDALLRIVAGRLRDAAGDALVARLGGDEFAVILTGDRQLPEPIARRIIAVVDEPIEIDGQQMAVGASVGIALAPDDGETADSLLKNADLALYRAKAEGRGTYRFFEAAMDARAQTRRAMEIDLRQALARGELRLFYQPLFDLADNRISGFEALMRWQHPVRGLVQPVDFIQIAEETGLIVPLGEWALREACREAAGWPGAMRIAVNVSPVQFRNAGLGEAVRRALADSGLPPAQLELEITESVFLDGKDATIQLLHGLRTQGVRIALDDFGTGYSSLSYLRSFPFDKIKIDRAFIMELLDGGRSAVAIVRAIADLAAALGMETTAEGVEDEGQLAELRAQGCSSVQGFLFSRPVPAVEVERMLETFISPDWGSKIRRAKVAA